MCKKCINQRNAAFMEVFMDKKNNNLFENVHLYTSLNCRGSCRAVRMCHWLGEDQILSQYNRFFKNCWYLLQPNFWIWEKKTTMTISEQTVMLIKAMKGGLKGLSLPKHLWILGAHQQGKSRSPLQAQPCCSSGLGCRGKWGLVTGSI